MIDEQLLELDGFRLTLSHEFISLHAEIEKIRPTSSGEALTLELAEQWRTLMDEASALTKEIDAAYSKLRPLHDLYEYQHGS